MKKKHEGEKYFIYNEHPPSLTPLCSNQLTWKLLGPTYMSYVAEIFGYNCMFSSTYSGLLVEAKEI